MLIGPHVELPAMLAAREARVQAQNDLRQAHPGCTLISFCLNIPGPVKTNQDLRQLFDDGLQEILTSLKKQQSTLLAQREKHEATGDECLLAVTGDASVIKAEMTKLEENHPLGRLFDIDVLNAEGEKLSRAIPRRCLLCDRQAQDCARIRRHSVEDLTSRINDMLLEYIKQ